MTEPAGPPSRVVQLLARAGEGSQPALDELLRHYGERLTALARRMLDGFPRVRRWADTGDVLQNALLRLVGALRDVRPASQREFLSLAALQIRRELIDLTRHFYGPQGHGARHDSAPRDGSAPDRLDGQPAPGGEPSSLVQWGELHRHIGELPEEEREVVGLLFYQGLAQAEAAEVLGVSLRTVQRRWHAALQKLHRVWSGGE
jgi:RNA polymerase sigma-70 factor (ECF subfamily)